MQETEPPACSRERMAGRHEGDHISLMWCLWLERLVCPRLGGQEGLLTHCSPVSSLSGFGEAVSLQPELLTPGTAEFLYILPQSFARPQMRPLRHRAGRSTGPLAKKLPQFMTHHPTLPGVTRDSISLCCSSISPPLIKAEDNRAASQLQTHTQHLSLQHFWTILPVVN